MRLSFGQGLASAKVFLKRVGQVPTGFKKLFFETKDALVLYSKKQSQARSAKKLKRREEELIRSNFASVQKLIVYFFLQLPPIIGILPTIIYLRYPRQLLTRHFWSDEEFKNYVVEEYQERRVHAIKLSHLLENAPPIPSSIPASVVAITAPITAINNKTATPHVDINTSTQSSSPVPPIVTYHLPLQLDHLSKEHIKTLAGANGICSTEFILNLAPSMLLKQWLKTRAEEIALDDQLLAQEGVDELAPNDLQVACLRRGLNPCLNQMKSSNTPIYNSSNNNPTQSSSSISDSSENNSSSSSLNSVTNNSTTASTGPTTVNAAGTTNDNNSINNTNNTSTTTINPNDAVPSTPSNEIAGQMKLREYLIRWINSSVSRHARSIQPTPVSLLTHAAALPELFLDNTTFTSFPPTESTK